MPRLMIGTDPVLINGQPITWPDPPAGWTPADTTATLAGWWAADDAATLTTSGGLVLAWADKSANARDWSALSGSRPQTGVDTIDGKNVLTFDGTASHMTMANGPTAVSSDSMLFIVAEDAKWGISLSKMLHFGQIAGGSFGRLQLMNDFSSPFKLTSFGHSGTGQTATELNAKALQLYGGYRAGTTQGVGFAGTYTTTSNGSDATIVGSWILGATTTPGAAEAFQGKMAEVVLCFSHDQAEREKIEGYLAHKWGLEADLPGAHPYKSAPPA